MKSIVVKERTYRLLRRLKDSSGVRSFDELLEIIALKELGLEDDMFGVDRGRLSPFTPEDRVEDR
ncbi:MAG: hypothetical protein AYL29_014030 [Candidatus Bathyarchaeota archaeon B24]|nr:MAG: hypothetical protein AYL29_014030 [Candidatus Bathyarchaeota archaeon B24]RLI25071.1 MAG: VapB-type antitoxin [Candidatus Bathyarchaeota archaeon]